MQSVAPFRLPLAAPRRALAPPRAARSHAAPAYAAPATKTAKAPLQLPQIIVPHVQPVPSPAPPSRIAQHSSRAWSLQALQQHAFAVLDDLHSRAAYRPDRKPLDAYFFAQKLVQVQRVRGLFQAAYDYADKHADHPALRAALCNDDFVAWIAAEPTLEQAVALAAAPPAAVVPGAMHRLRNAMAQLQLLRQNWPAQAA